LKKWQEAIVCFLPFCSLWGCYDPGDLFADALAIRRVSKRQSPQLLAAD